MRLSYNFDPPNSDMTMQPSISDIWNLLTCTNSLAHADGLTVNCPADGTKLAVLKTDSAVSLDMKITNAVGAAAAWQVLTRRKRLMHIEAFSQALRDKREILARLITLEGGKTHKEGQAECDGSADILLKTAKDAELADFAGMVRVKERPPVGLIGLITSFNFPLVVAHWTLAPALLAGNSVLWKPSEKTPLTALAVKTIFDQAMGRYAGLLQVIIGAHDISATMVADERVDMISATGSVGMGQAIKATLANKQNNAVLPILELGGNNGMIVSSQLSDVQLEWSLNALLTSFFGTGGQRCTNTRRLIVARKSYDKTVAILSRDTKRFINSGMIASPLEGESNEYGYAPLIDEDAFWRFEQAKARVIAEGGSVRFGKRVLAAQWPDAYYVEPALALLPKQGAMMMEETFAPLLYVVPYDGDIEQAMELLNQPDNAGLVNGIYTQSQKEADAFVKANQAGHGVINSPKGTGTPAFGMGFGGNKASGEGEILNAADPLRPFTCAVYHRIAQNADVALHD